MFDKFLTIFFKLIQKSVYILIAVAKKLGLMPIFKFFL